MREQGSQDEQARRGGGELERGRSGVREMGLPGMRLGQLLDEIFGAAPSQGFGQRGAWPAIDVDETDEAYSICMEIPGVRRDDLEVDVEGSVVTVRGEKRRRDEGGRARWSERSYGGFVRSFGLPSEVDTEQASASFEDGVLTLRFPKRESARPRRLEIRAAQRGSNGGGGERLGEGEARA